MTDQATTRQDEAVCGNCRTPLLGAHCHACGQPVKGLVRPLSGWIADFFDTALNYDGRIWRTLTPLLLRPGFLTREYIAGRRIRYVTPVRLFLILIFILFVVVQLAARIDISRELAEMTPAKEDEPRIERIVSWLPEQTRRAVIADALAPPLLSSDTGAETAPSTGNQAIQINLGEDRGRAPSQLLPWLPERLKPGFDAAVERLKANAQRVGNDPNALFTAMFSVAPQVLICTLPIFALLLKLAYLFKRKLYLHHLLVALHSHSFIALTLILICLLSLLAGWLGPGWLSTGLGWLMVALAVWIPLNLLLTQKRVYDQGWVMTLIKYAVIGTVYLVLLSFAAVLAFLIGLWAM